MKKTVQYIQHGRPFDFEIASVSQKQPKQ